MGLKAEEAHSAIRISLGRSTTEEEVERALEILAEIVARLRETSPLSKAKG
jgi:cysteine desulfurase